MPTDPSNPRFISSNVRKADDDDHNRALIRKYFELVDAANIEQLLSLFHPEISYQRPGHADIDGLAALAAFYRRERLIESGKHTIDAVLSDGNLAAVKGSFRGVLKDGTAAHVLFADFYQIREGQIWRRQTFFTGSAI